MRKKILSMMLTICMVLMLMPQMVFAESYGDFNYTVSDDKVTITGYTGSGGAVVIPDTINGNTVIAIGNSAFLAKSNIKSVTIPNSVTSIGIGAFHKCESLASINIPDGVTSIGKQAFYLCSSLSSVTFGNDSQLTSIGDEAFYSCTRLESITIPDGVTSIGYEVFSRCERLASIDIPDGVTTIGNSAFVRCTSLARVAFGDNSQLASIGVQAFSNCASLKSIEIPSSVTSIGYGAFVSCTSLESIEIPGNVTSIEKATFYLCSSLSSVTFGKDSQLTSIGANVFWECTSLERIEIPGSVTSIGNYAFDGCTSLESIFLPKDLEVTDAGIPDATSQVRYSLDTERGEVTITGIELGTGEISVAIPEKILGYPIIAVAASEQSKVGLHTCKGGTATCTAKAFCSICGKEYGDLLDHNIVKTPSKAPTYYEAGHKEYWECTVCQKFFSDADGKNEISNLDAWKAGDGRIDKLIPPKTDSVTSDRDGNIIVSIEKSISTVDGKTKASITDAVAESILDKLGSSESKSVVINVSAGSISSKPAASGASTEISISGAALKKLSEVEGIKITFVTDNGKVVLDGQALAAASKSADEDGKVTFLIETVEQTGSILKLELKIKASSGDVTDFGGGIAAVTVAISDELKDRNPVCVYIDAQGIYHMIGGKLNDDGTFTFVTGHFSTYAIMPEEEAAAVIKEQTEDAQKEAIKKVKPSVSLTTKRLKKGIKVTVKVPASQKADKTGVIIYRSQKKSSGYAEYKRVKTSGSSYTVTNTKNIKGKRLVKGRKYYYKARAYKVIDGKTYYGPMSSIKYAKAR